MNLAVLFGLLSAASWGAGDFCGGLATRRTAVLSVVTFSQIVGALLLGTLAVALGEAIPPPTHLALGGIAGIAGDIGLLSLYWALANGKMGVAAPISGVVAVMLPLMVSFMTDGAPAVLQLAGFVLALAGIWLVARSEDSALRLNDVGLPIVSGIGFGLFLILIDRVSDTSVFWPLVAARVASIVFLMVVSLIRRQSPLPPVQRMPLIALSGLFDAGGNAFFALAAQTGRLDVASVLSSFYSATTVLLAWAILKERLSRPQTWGVAATLAAIALIVL